MIRRSNRTIAYVIMALVALASMALVALASMALLPATALAAPGVPVERIDIQVDPTDSAGTLYIVTATIPAATPLPATIRLSMPQGATVGWAGEVLGGPLENDPTIEPVIEHGENGYDIVSLTLTKARRGQLELTVSGLLVQNGDNRTLRAAYFPVDAVGTVSIAALVPAGGVIETSTPGAIKSPGPANGTILSLETSGTAGTEVALDVRFTQSAPAATTTGGSNAAVYVIFALVIAAFAFLMVAVSKRTKQRSALGDEDEADPSEPAGKAVPQVAASETVHTAEEPDGGSPVIATKKRLTPQVVIIAVVVAVLGGAVVMMTSGESPGTTKSTNEYTYKVLTAADADATLIVPITLAEADPAHESVHVFEAVTGVAGIRSMKLTYAGSTVEIKYDSAQIDEAAIRSTLTAGGYPPSGS